jgi:hypothetical protein
MLLDRIEMMGIETERVIEELPTGFDELRAEAHMEGYCQIERLATDWDAGTTRFDRDGEVLLVVRVNETLVAIRWPHSRTGRAKRFAHAALLCSACLSP